MRPLQRRLLELAGGRRHLALAAVLGVADAGLLVAQAALLSHVVVAAFLHGRDLPALATELALLPVVLALRGAVVWLNETAGQARAAGVRTRLRAQLCARVLDLGPAWLAGQRRGELATVLTDGMDALDAFYARYLPQLVRAVVVPATVLAWVLPLDLVSGAVIGLTLPLVPIFMALVGLAARDRTDRRWRAMAILGGHFLDVLRGLPTLRLFGRAQAQRDSIALVADQHRRATLSALRVAFLSSLVLELAATVSTALVAVAIGLRLAAGGLGLEPGLAVLVLTPEVYLPLRRLGAQFHASMDALAPAGRAFELLDAAASPAFGGGVPDLARDTIRLHGVRVSRPGRGVVLDGIDLTVRAGERVALVGATGAGKTTLLHLLLGFLAPDIGGVTVGGAPLASLSLDELRAQIGWVPQRPSLFSGTIADNIRVGDPEASPAAVAAAAAEAGLDLPLDTPAGENGSALSAGQRQRVAMARALVRRPPLLLLDEPTANLDAGAQEAMARWLTSLRDTTVVLAVHSARLAAAADRVVELRGGRVAERAA